MWRFEGNDTEGIITNGQESYSYEVDDGEVRICLPFGINEETFKENLERDGWSVDRDHDRSESLGWGPQHDAEGYYPYWLRTNPHNSETILAIPPQDYRIPGNTMRSETGGDVEEKQASGHTPIFGSGALHEFEKWLPYVQEAAGSRLDPVTR